MIDFCKKPVTIGPRAAKSFIVSEEDQELRALMMRYQRGSLEAFQEIYAQLAPGVRRYLSHLAGGPEIADDLLQETFLQNAPVESRIQPEICG